MSGIQVTIHNDVTLMCTNKSLAPGWPSCAARSGSDPDHHVCLTKLSDREKWFLQVLSSVTQSVTLAPASARTILQQSGKSYSDGSDITSRPTSQSSSSHKDTTTSTLATSLAFTGADNAKFTITGYDAKTKLWSIDSKTCEYFGLDEGTGLTIEPVCSGAYPLARISVTASDGKKWYLTAGFFEAVPSIYSSGYASIVFWSSSACKADFSHCQAWQIVDANTVPPFNLSRESLVANTGATVNAPLWQRWLKNIRNGDGPLTIDSVGMIDITSEYLLPYAVSTNPTPNPGDSFQTTRMTALMQDRI